tara:strand:- start:3014 stop:3244 length:231 start_codon:yes stop_codon:yes gene_type:complete
MQTWALLAAIKALSASVDELIKKVDDMQHQIDALAEEWRNEYELESETDSLSDSDDSVSSCQSAPATFSYKRQRTE